MNRILSLLFFFLLLALICAASVIEPVRTGDFSSTRMILSASLTFLCVTGAGLYCGFAALHATQRVSDPRDRTTWLILIVPFTIFGALLYLMTKYQHFRRIGKGGLMRDRRKYSFIEFSRLSHEEEMEE
jgi:hypothetical protein